jgi:hypothetical protein
MNDPQIREAFHRTVLRKHHKSVNTLVVDELGIEHGKGRADIAVINGQMIGYEIKSETDTLNRLSNQIKRYNAVFDRAFVILAEHHLDAVMSIIPKWWGVILVIKKKNNKIYFRTVRHALTNNQVSNFSIAQLLWRNEAQEILKGLGFSEKQLRERRSVLYSYIVDKLASEELRYTVREYLKKRQNWRHPSQLPLNGD